MNKSADEFDVLIVGSGPGGMVAAVTAAGRGKRVAIVDDNPSSGGQIWRHGGGGPQSVAALKWYLPFQHLKKTGALQVLQQTRVVAIPTTRVLLAETPEGPRLLKYRTLILATGSRELFLPFPGWTLPGVFGAGGIQALVKSGLSVEGKRVVVAGSGPLLLAVADLLRSKGAIVLMIIEQAPRSRINRFAFSLLRSPAKLLSALVLKSRLVRIPYRVDSYPLRVSVVNDSLRVDLRIASRETTVECDYLASGFGLIPNAELAQMVGCAIDASGFVKIDETCRTSVPDVYAVGELTGIGGVDKAIVEGQIAGWSAIGDRTQAGKLSSALANSNAFARRLETAFELRPEVLKLAAPETIVCRCEDVPLSALQGRLGARDAKLQTRCGMGPCQGRVCGPILQRLMGAEAPSVRPPILPTSIATLAAAGSASDDATM